MKRASLKRLKDLAEETRKVQLTGRSTYVISLPKRWAVEAGLKPGSQVLISRQSGTSLLISATKGEEPKELKEALIDVTKEERVDAVERKVASAYLAGYSLVRVRATDGMTPLQRAALRDFVRKTLIGTEVIFDSPEEMTFQVLLKYPELPLESALRRMCLIASSMHEDAIFALKDLNKELAKDVAARDDEVDRFHFYIVRQLEAAAQDGRILDEAGLSSPRDCLSYRLVAKSVERIADHAVRIAENVLAMERAMDDEVFQRIVEMSSLSRIVFDNAVKSLFKGDYELAEETVKEAKDITSFEHKVMAFVSERVDPKEASNVKLILESIRRTAEYASDIAEIVLNLNIDRMLSSLTRSRAELR